MSVSFKVLCCASVLGASEACAAVYHEYRFDAVLTYVDLDSPSYYDEDTENRVELGAAYIPVGAFQLSSGYPYSDIFGASYLDQRLASRLSFSVGNDGVEDLECLIGTYACRFDRDYPNVDFDGTDLRYSESDGYSYIFSLDFSIGDGSFSGGAYLANDWGGWGVDELYAFEYYGSDSNVEFVDVQKIAPIPLPASALLLGLVFALPLLRSSKRTARPD